MRASPGAGGAKTVPIRASCDPDDAALVRRALNQDRWAEEALYRRHVHAITRTAIRVLGSTADAEDVVQEAFATALSHLPQLRDGASFGGWLARTALNLMRIRLRTRRLWRLVGLDSGDDAGLTQLASPAASPEQLAELRLVDRALKKMGAEPRMAWVLRHVEGWQLEEVAAQLSVSLATAKRRLAKAEQRIAVTFMRDGALPRGPAGGEAGGHP